MNVREQRAFKTKIKLQIAIKSQTKTKMKISEGPDGPGQPRTQKNQQRTAKKIHGRETRNQRRPQQSSQPLINLVWIF
jgi:hypothetical protein